MGLGLLDVGRGSLGCVVVVVVGCEKREERSPVRRGEDAIGLRGGVAEVREQVFFAEAQSRVEVGGWVGGVGEVDG